MLIGWRGSDCASWFGYLGEEVLVSGLGWTNDFTWNLCDWLRGHSDSERWVGAVRGIAGAAARGVPAP